MGFYVMRIIPITMQAMHTDASPPLATAPQAVTTPPLPGTPLPCVPSRALFGSAREVHIDHEGQLYRLRITALGKLILTK